ncbi:MAG: hypothetical protein KKG76_13225 [Euryarchaeota archaeon]|nr:hypothetical protein [Euryarchaeota archaeon]MBU4138575.1 hypothetical protein [Euryarchaeota archaeon]
MKKFIKSEIAVSEAVGFIQTLAIVIISTSIVYFAGAPMLEKAEKNAHFLEMEKAFTLLSGNLEKIGFDRAPIRNTELKIMGGAMLVAHDSTITINDYSFAVGSIEYRFEDRVIAYENGGIWIKHPGDEVTIVSKPRFSTGNLTTIPMLELLGDYWIAGEGGIRIHSKILSSTLYSIPAENGTVSIKVNSSYYKGWKEYLVRIGATDPVIDDAGTTVTTNFTTDMVNVDHSQIIIKMLEE